MLAAVQAQPEDEVGVERVRDAVQAALDAAPAALATCGQLEGQARTRLLLMTARQDVAVAQAAVASVMDTLASWHELQQCAQRRDVQGVQLPSVVSPSSSQAVLGRDSSAASSRRPSRVMPRRSRNLPQQSSGASSAGSAASKRKESVQQPSRVPRRGGKT
jgi:hypothetical protein